jgi:hypothetical protein
MSEGLLTALAVIGLLILLEGLDILGALKRKIRGEASPAEWEKRVADLEARMDEMERKVSNA